MEKRIRTDRRTSIPKGDWGAQVDEFNLHLLHRTIGEDGDCIAHFEHVPNPDGPGILSEALFAEVWYRRIVVRLVTKGWHPQVNFGRDTLLTPPIYRPLPLENVVRAHWRYRSAAVARQAIAEARKRREASDAFIAAVDRAKAAEAEALALPSPENIQAQQSTFAVAVVAMDHLDNTGRI